MRLSRIISAGRYECLHPLFPAAFRFLVEENLEALSPGRHEVDGDRLYAVVFHGTGRGSAEALLETHRRYVDIQAIVSGMDLMGWTSLEECKTYGLGYDEEKETEFYRVEPTVFFPVFPGHFAVFFPEDAHAPLAGVDPVRKVVMKVRLD